MGWEKCLYVVILLWMASIVVHAKEPCPYEDTVDLTNATKLDSGYYSYNGVVLAPHEVAEYSYEINFKNENVTAPKHLRGCVCSKRTCIPLCCKNAEECLPNTLVANISIGGNIVEKLIKDEFIIQIMKPSQQESLFILDNPFVIHENGSIDTEFFGLTNKNDYCLENSNGQILIIQDASNLVYDDLSNIHIYVSFLSIPFMILTICVYFYIGEVRNNYTKAFICYLFGLSLGYLFLTLRVLLPNIHYHEIVCKISGFTSYYCFMMAFCAINVISYDIWYNFRGTRRYEDHKKFLIYAMYIFGIPLLFLIITVAAQELQFCPDNLKPGISPENGCWLNNTQRLAPFIYFFGPMLIIILANTLMFILTARKLYRIQKKYATTMTTQSNTMRNLRTEKARFGLYLRLFVLMGILWIFELANFFAGQSEENSKLFFVTDLLSALQGVIIFVLFVLRKPVRRAVKNKMCNSNNIDTSSEGSYAINGDVLQGHGAATLLTLRETEA